MKSKDNSSIANRWNAGETGCGRLVVELCRELTTLKPGDLLEVTALDTGAPADLPAWCRMTGHCLVSAEHPTYIIRKRTA
jgi:tRNA 2-thiouridine synthesizing protein A